MLLYAMHEKVNNEKKEQISSPGLVLVSLWAIDLKLPLSYVGKMKKTIFPETSCAFKDNNKSLHGKFHRFLLPNSTPKLRPSSSYLLMLYSKNRRIKT